MNKFTAYIGTYTSGESDGIYSFKVDASSGKTSDLKLAAKLENPTYLAFDNNNTHLYSVAKSDKLGAAAAFSMNNGNLIFLNSECADKNPPAELEGKQPCHVYLDKENKYLFSSNYHAGRIEVFPINSDGSLGKVSSSIVHAGQEKKPHVHCGIVTPDNNYLCVVDLGLDKVIAYTFKNGILSKVNELNLKSGCGPRHMTFSKDGRFAYIYTELSSEVVVLTYSPSDCSFNILQYISSLPKDYTGHNQGAAIHISPDGNFLYTSNRGHDSISCFKINTSTGMLELSYVTSVEGISPRDFNITPNGNFILAANQDSNNVTVFKVNKTSGEIMYINEDIKIGSPVCVKIL
ncbi:lactonase family protein [Clostridium hydrogenum]|uniref:lactonase family protein n=1 Tax=Clostridium hydrogenum TaxID=2855764 RepID=UPI001F2ADCE4|nr:lactonase family protein [Clostridium hydrogenum]